MKIDDSVDWGVKYIVGVKFVDGVDVGVSKGVGDEIGRAIGGGVRSCVFGGGNRDIGAVIDIDVCDGVGGGDDDGDCE